ncbi:hypothetical protein LCGC14_1615280 [marine sediment metagenome]|uniref:Serine aminopeptidase S33 domain-containing protein n=1 Tax=marine sediment metagenome TaxID=412755 RepID=A0A0F9KML5_9ZZZZ
MVKKLLIDNPAVSDIVFYPRKIPIPEREELNVRILRFQIQKNVELGGFFYLNNPNFPTILFFHGNGEIAADYQSFLNFFFKCDVNLAVIDFRGYGLSEGTKNIPQIDMDMLAAAQTLQKETEKIYVIGASMGGIAALNAALKLEVSGIISLSAPQEFMGLKPGNVEDIKAPKLFLASAGDRIAADSARVFYEQANEPREIEILKGNKHGTDMLRDQNSEAFELITNWLERHK